ncbi:sulfite exporter TauE/SafE family protein [Paraconexibacter algicola]|uniref:Probable membrane transporter protein n=1 Tax=Paraconexibacter algicola TaxID=2133960 RepID=A0A2T4UKE2_9ACTN|nr:sulfite exporter TauE/SafE family protein [Paraconexibacter algicola]PTL59713.1 hypothetical protein C7Y72_08635 [Paraconexibacter algicola]
MIALAIPFGLAIGLVVGTVGGGGAILALPVLVYVLGEPPGPASTASLVVVALAAAVGAGRPALDGKVCWRVALLFAGPAALGALGGAVLNEQADPKVLVLSFIPVMLTAAAATWRRACEDHEGEEDGLCAVVTARRIAPAGLGVGLLTGFFGVGGGFVIVPLLTVWLGMRFRRAVATSLVIITLTGLAALASHLVAGAGLADIGLTAALAGATATGALAGSFVGARLPQATLGKAFAVMVVAVAAFLLVDVSLLGGPPG